MKKLILFIIIGFTFNCCHRTITKDEKFISLDFEVINFPFHKVDSIYIDSNSLIIDLIDFKTFNNPTIFLQSLTWYSLQMANLKEKFDSVRINKIMPNRDSIIEVYSNTIPSSQIKRLREQLDNTIFGNFYLDFIKLNWKTRDNYQVNQSSILDRTNTLFARKIDTSYYKDKFPNNSTWYGIDCFQIFQVYFQECKKEKPQIGTDLVSEIVGSSEYFNESDKQEIVNLIQSYTEQFKKQ